MLSTLFWAGLMFYHLFHVIAHGNPISGAYAVACLAMVEINILKNKNNA